MLDTLSDAARFLWENVHIIGFKDILDIAIVAFLIYKLITFFSRTGSGRVVRGVVLLLALMWIASLLKLPVVNYMMGQALQLGITAIIIVFQPELRRLLERVGSSDFSFVFGSGGKSAAKETEAAITAVVSSCAYFSKNYTGALIVFERKFKLDEYLKSGVHIEAIVNSDLLENVFYNKTPLHDGAAIIRNGRISAAKCMLPNSANPNIDRNLGTRHRAAIGLTELTDAISVVVSEETGAISVAIEGMLKTRLSADMLQQLLRKNLLPEDANHTIIDRIRTVGRREKV